MSRLDILQLLSSLQNLYFRMAHLRLNTRIDSYGGDSGHEVMKDISTPLSEHIETLARKAVDERVNAPDGETNSPHTPSESPRSSHSKHRPAKTQFMRSGMNGLSRLFKRRSATIVVQPHLSDQLQRSVRQHLNTALRQARQGDSKNAKLHADLACNGMHELLRCMPQENFARFNRQIIDNLKEFRDQDAFRPLTELLDCEATATLQ